MRKATKAREVIAPYLVERLVGLDARPNTTLGDLVTIVRGVSYKKEQASDVPKENYAPILRATNIQRDLVFDDLVYVPENVISDDQWLQPHDIVVAASSGSRNVVGKAAQLVEEWHGGFGAFCFALRPKPGTDPRYLAWFLQTPMYRQRVSELAAGVNINNLRARHIEETPIPLPPLGEQRRIVAEIEEQLTRLEAGVAALKRVQANLKRYKAAVLKAAVERRLVPTERPWTQIELGEIALSIRNGYSKKPDAEQGTRIFRISAVRPLELDVDDVRFLSGNPSDYEPFLVAPGDVLFTRYNGSRDYVGVCAQVPMDLPPTVYPDKLIRVRVPVSSVLPKFLVIAASTGRAREYIESKIRTTAGQSGISGGDLKSLPLEIPSLTEQHRIVDGVDHRFSVIEGTETQVQDDLARADRLRQAVLRVAFQTQ